MCVPLAEFRKVMAEAQAYARARAAHFIGFDEFQERNGIVASGTFVSVNGQLYVATAAHNIDDGRHMATRAMMVLTEAKRTNSVFAVLGGYSRGGKAAHDEEWDLAAVQLPPQVLDRTQRLWITDRHVDLDWKPTPNELVLMYGLTEDRVEANEHGGKFGEHAYFTVPLMTEPEGATVRPDVDLFFQYPKDGTAYGDGMMQKPWSPKGMSGGSVWALNMHEGVAWDSTMMRLVGIVIESHVREDWVRASRIARWVDVVKLAERHRLELRPLP
jgi:hypothetical protein